MNSKMSASLTASPKLGLPVVLFLLFVTMAILFRNQFLPGHTLFSNDGPLGALMAKSHQVPAAFSGAWQDLNSIGFREGGAFPDITYGLLWILGPIGFSKFYASIVMMILGISAWCFFRQAGLAPIACVLGGLAAALNSGFFAAACWGVGTHPLTIGMNFLALAALVDTSSRRKWLRTVLAGAAVGMGVMEGADIGAIFSLFVAAFAVYRACVEEGPTRRNVAMGIARVAIVALVAAFLAWHAISVLVGTQIKGVVGTQQDEQTKQQHWDFATQWSLPKREALSFIAPGVFGYRMDTANGGAYWGAIGRDPNWDRYFASGKQGPPPAGTIRFGGGGIYAGILVALVALWAVLQSLRKDGSAFSLPNRRWIWFWSVVAVISLLLSFGRFAPFYQFLYALPYFSTIRNPAKFGHVFNWATVILFAYGVHGLYRRYMETSSTSAVLSESLMAWWQRVRGFDRRWTLGCLAAIGVSLLALLIYASSRDGLEKYLQEVQFAPDMAHDIAGFSIAQAAWAIVFLAVAAGLVILVLSGKFRGPRAKWGGVLLGLFLAIDLGRANQPWVITWDYQQKYSSNPIIDLLRQKPYEHRVAGLPRWLLQVFKVQPQLAETEQYFRQLYGIEWTQHHFLYYNVHCLDIIQMPRMPEDLAAFEMALSPHTGPDISRVVARRWELTNTRYLLGSAPFLDLLNSQFDPAQHRFRIVERFQIAPKPGITQPTKLEELTAVPNTNGPYALFEFTGALPRAKLYSNWQVTTNDQAALDQLTNASFHPDQTVLVGGGLPTSASTSGTTNQNTGSVEFTGYAPKDIVFNANAASPSILLLNDRYDPNWKVFVDDKPDTLLRCNYLMRGVYLTPGSHKVEFRFEPPVNTIYVSAAAIGLAFLLCGLLVVVKDPPQAPDERAPIPSPRQAKVPAART